MKAKTLFLDWHETLSSDRFFDTLRHSDKPDWQTIAYRLEQFLFNEHNTLIRPWMIGQTSSEQVIGRAAQQCDLAYDWLWPVFVADCKNMHMAPGLREKIMPLRQDYNVVLITGNMDSFNRFTRPHNDLDTCFDLVINSCDQGYLKSDYDGKSFIDALASYQTAASEAVLIDDNQAVGAVFTTLGGDYQPVKNPQDTSRRLDELLFI